MDAENQKPTTPAEARQAGLRRYASGQPCPAGHIAERYTSTRACVECVTAKCRTWRATNPEKLSSYSRSWKDSNREAVRSHVRNRDARLRDASGTHSARDINALLIRQKNKCANCSANLKKSGHNADHVVPLAKGGANDIKNLQMLCPTCNRRKHAKHPLDFAREQGRLF